MFTINFYIFAKYVGVEIVLVIDQRVVVTTLGIGARVVISQCAPSYDRGA
jgi:hypothetical protein